MGLGVHDGGLQRNDRNVTRILFAGRDYGYFAVCSVNDNEVKMSFHTLQELNLDAARYRWLRENFGIVDWSSFYDTDSDDELDKFIDAELARDA